MFNKNGKPMINDLISIVLPVYNGEKYLTQSIESIINQTYKNWELIIINDCSTDNSLKIAEEYAGADSRIKVFSNETNLKLPKSLNAGFEKASGEFFTWTSDDNMYKPEALEILLNKLKLDTETVMAYADMDIINENDNLIENRIHNEPYMLCLSNCCGACFLYRAEAAKAVGVYNPEFFLAEDYEYWLRLFRYGKLKHICKTIYYYRSHPASLSGTRLADIKAVTNRLINENFDFLHKLSLDNNIEFEFFEAILYRCSDETERKQYRNRFFKISKRYLIKKIRKKVKRIIRQSPAGPVLVKLKGKFIK